MSEAPPLNRWATPVDQSPSAPAARTIRVLVWVYLFLLLFEGALRKWISPGYSAPLLIIRDPLVVIIYACALSAGLFPTGRLLTFFWMVVIGSSAFGVVAEQFGWKVFLFGWRTNFLHIPLIFLLPRVMGYRDVVLMGRWFIIIAIPMTFLVVRQFMAAPTDIINTAAGGTGSQLGTSGGKVRASGTFSFVIGVVCFYATVAGFVMNGLLRRGTYAWWLLAAGAGSVVVATATSGSRSALAGVLTVVAAVAIVLIVKPGLLGQVVTALALVALIAGVALQLGVVKLGANVMSQRFEDAGGSSGIWPRVFGGYMVPVEASGRAPFLGYGLGLGTNAGAALATGEVVPFTLGENEWQRVVMESGPLMGNLFLIWRWSLVVYLFVVSLRAVRLGNVLPMMLFGGTAPLLHSGQFGQPTLLGFVALGAGLLLAAANEDAAPSAAHSTPAVTLPPRVRSRSRYAEILHGRRS